MSDGRELWVLAEMHDVQALKRWLLNAAIDSRTVGPVMQFALEAPYGRKDVVTACLEDAALGFEGMCEADMRGVSFHTARELLVAYLENSKEKLSVRELKGGIQCMIRLGSRTHANNTQTHTKHTNTQTHKHTNTQTHTPKFARTRANTKKLRKRCFSDSDLGAHLFDRIPVRSKLVQRKRRVTALQARMLRRADEPAGLWEVAQ
jgi:hypothetical protein